MLIIGVKKKRKVVDTKPISLKESLHYAEQFIVVESDPDHNVTI